MLFWQHLGLNQSWNGVGPKRSQTLLTQQILFFTKFLKNMVTNFPCMLMQCLTCWFPVEHVTCFSSVMGSLPNDPWLLRGKRFQMMAVGEKKHEGVFFALPHHPHSIDIIFTGTHARFRKSFESAGGRYWRRRPCLNDPSFHRQCRLGTSWEMVSTFSEHPWMRPFLSASWGKNWTKKHACMPTQNKASFFRGLWL